MKIAVKGNGGVGGYFGPKLAAGGRQVTVIVRKAHLTAIRRNGLRVPTLSGLIFRPAGSSRCSLREHRPAREKIFT
jgi:2-dehydropantoate 2-reductase